MQIFLLCYAFEQFLLIIKPLSHSPFILYNQFSDTEKQIHRKGNAFTFFLFNIYSYFRYLSNLFFSLSTKTNQFID